MSQVNSGSEINHLSRKIKAGVKRMQRHNLRVDMTPMVDLGFLLITFFILTTELNKPVVMNLFMPKDGPGMPLGESDALTVLLKDNKLFYYTGMWEEAVAKQSIYEINFSGNNSLRKIIEYKQTQLDGASGNKEGRNGLMLIIKPDSNVSYKQVVDILDETTISQLKKYALVKPSTAESAWLQAKFQ